MNLISYIYLSLINEFNLAQRPDAEAGGWWRAAKIGLFLWRGERADAPSLRAACSKHLK